MTIRVSAIEPNPTHDVSLTYQGVTVGLHLCNARGEPDHRSIRHGNNPRTSLQIQQGDPTYSGFRMPYTPITQKNWSGGRGAADFNKDSTRYYDSYGVDTRFGDIILGPRATVIALPDYSTDPYSYDATVVVPENTYYATMWTPAANITVKQIVLPIYAKSGSGIVTVTVYGNSSGGIGDQPDTLSKLAEGKKAIGIKTEAEDVLVSIDSVALTAGTKYWVVVRCENGTGTLTLYKDTNEPASRIESNLIGTWELVTEDQAIAFKFSPLAPGRFILFEYKGLTYAVHSPDDGTAPRLYMNGFRGLGAANSGNLDRTYTALSSFGWVAGSAIKIIAGPGFEESQNWRTISTYSVNYAYVSPSWITPQSTASHWVITESTYWTEVTGHGLTKPVTSVLVVDDIIYFAQGDSTPIRRGRVTSAVAWDTWEDDADIDATYKGATFLEMIQNSDGQRKIWYAQATTSKVGSADVKAWAAGGSGDLTWGTAIICGNPAWKITNLIAYDHLPYIMKEDSFGSIGAGIYAEIPLGELRTVASEKNGKAAGVYNVYLFFSMGNGLERYYDGRLDDMGPNRDEGLPGTRNRPITSLLPSPGGVIVGLDGGYDGYSSILFWNELGWHELYRAPVGERITDMHIQTTPSSDWRDKLWFNQGNALAWIPISITPRIDSSYPYTDTGYLITSWYSGNFQEIKKYLDSLHLFTENLSANVNVSVAYQTDVENENTWHDLPSTFTTSPAQKVAFTADRTAQGCRWRLKVTLTTNSMFSTPRVIAWTMDTVTRVPVEKSFTLTFQADDVTVSMSDGEEDALDMDALLTQLEEWGSSESTPLPVHMRSIIPKYDDLYLFLDAPNVQLREVAIAEDTRDLKAIGTVNAYQVD